MTAFPTADREIASIREHSRANPVYSVVIPFFNEEANVAALLSELRTTLDILRAAYEVVLVDDGSTDGTAAALKKSADGWIECQLITCSTNRGQAAALLTAFGRARGEVLITLDGDGQNDPADIIRLLECLDR